MKTKIKTLRLGNGTVMRHYFTLVLPLTEAQLVSYMGNPCEEHEVGCIVCKTWAAWKKNGCLTMEANHDLAVKRLMNGEV
jgi:hypothetical protein